MALAVRVISESEIRATMAYWLAELSRQRANLSSVLQAEHAKGDTRGAAHTYALLDQDTARVGMLRLMAESLHLDWDAICHESSARIA